jgi:hypothetical protein
VALLRGEGDAAEQIAHNHVIKLKTAVRALL